MPAKEYFIKGIAFALLCGTMFLSAGGLMDGTILPKNYAFLSGVAAWTAVAVALPGKRDGTGIDLLTLLFGIGIVYLAVRIFLSERTGGIGLWYTPALLCLYFLCRGLSGSDVSFFRGTIAGACTIEAVYGLLQYAGIVEQTSRFPITGTFDNPAGFAACLSAGYPFCLFLLNEARKRIRLAGAASAGIVALSIGLSESRSGILAVVAVSALFILYKYREQAGRHRKTVGAIGVSGSLLLLAGLFFCNSQSASGRLLIWNVTAAIIGDHPLAGIGAGGFRALYMPYQAEYFSLHPDSAFSMLAGNTSHPFNEYLLLAAQYGIPALILLGAIFGTAAAFNCKKLSPESAALLAVAAFACFSYPFRYPFVWIVVAYALAQLSKRVPVIYRFPSRIRTWMKVPAAIVAAAIALSLAKDIRFERRWNRIAQESLAGQTQEMLPAYDSLYARWNGNPLFVYNYAAELNFTKAYLKSSELLRVCAKRLDDYDIQRMLADNAKNLKNWTEAEKHYRTAASMCPNRFVPLGELMTVYRQTGDTLSAVRTARTIVGKEIKVSSPTIAIILNKAESFLAETGQHE